MLVFHKCILLIISALSAFPSKIINIDKDIMLSATHIRDGRTTLTIFKSNKIKGTIPNNISIIK